MSSRKRQRCSLGFFDDTCVLAPPEWVHELYKAFRTALVLASGRAMSRRAQHPFGSNVFVQRQFVQSTAAFSTASLRLQPAGHYHLRIFPPGATSVFRRAQFPLLLQYGGFRQALADKRAA